jgi:hypothetical protein
MVLAEQVNGFKMMISDLKTKIKDLDNEKLSYNGKDFTGRSKM